MINKIKNNIDTSVKKRPNGFKDLTGMRFGKCTVIRHFGSEIVGKDNKGREKRKSVWLCRCDCKNLFLTRGASLTSSRTISCGCYAIARLIKFNKETKAKISYNSFSDVRQSYKRGAKNRGLEYQLNNEQFFELCTGNCHYCGKFPDKFRKKRTKTPNSFAEFHHNGIDRVDNNIGYIYNNCVSCCTNCNRMKRSMSVSDFFNHIKKIYKHSRLDI